MKIALITVNFGNYDSFKEPKNLKNVEMFDWYYFTDLEIKSTVYKVITHPYHLDEFSLESKKIYWAKYYKMQHHKIDLLKNYDYIIWLDASFEILNVNFVNDIINLINQQNMILMYHPHRTTIKEEVDILNRMPKFKGQDFNKQYNAYIKEGFNDDKGLYSSGFIIRKINDFMNKFFDDWFNEIKKYTYRDQVSFSYVLWKNNIMPDIVIKQNVFNNKLIGNVLKHK